VSSSSSSSTETSDGDCLCVDAVFLSRLSVSTTKIIVTVRFFEPNNGFTGVPISNKIILLISSLGFGALGIVLFGILRRRQSTIHSGGRNAYGELLDQSNVATLNRAQRKAKARLQVKRLQRTVAPVQNNADEGQELVEGADLENEDGNLDLAGANLSRRERRKAAKEMEREERKTYAEEARLWREKNHSTNSSSRRKCKNELLQNPIYDIGEND